MAGEADGHVARRADVGLERGAPRTRRQVHTRWSHPERTRSRAADQNARSGQDISKPSARPTLSLIGIRIGIRLWLRGSTQRRLSLFGTVRRKLGRAFGDALLCGLGEPRP